MAKYAWPLPGEGVTAEELAIAEIRTALPGVNAYSGQARKDAMLAEIVAALFNGQSVPFPTFSGDLTLPARLLFSSAVGKLVPGATSFSLRNTADNADNLLITDAGAITVRNTVSGITTLTATTLAGTLSTPAQPNVTSLGTLTGLSVSAAPTFGVGGSASVAKPAQVLFQAQGLSTSSTTPVSLTSFSLPANALAVNAQAIRLTLMGGAATQNANISVQFGGTALAATLITAGNGFIAWVHIARTGAATQIYNRSLIQGTAVVSTQGTLAITLSNAALVDVQASVSSGGTLTVDSVLLEYLAQ